MANIKSKVVTAPRCRILLDTKVMGWGTNISYNVDYEMNPLDVIDNFEVEEFVPVGYTVNGTISKVGVNNVSLRTMGLFPRVGVDSDAHLLNFLLLGDHTIQLIDKFGDAGSEKTLAIVYGVKFGSKGWNVAARGIAGEDINFVAKREKDFSEI